MLDPFGMGRDLVALIMRSLRWLGDAEQGGGNMSPGDRQRYLRIASACEDYLAADRGDAEAKEDALARMSDLFDRWIMGTLWM